MGTRIVTIQCLGDAPGSKFLDGRTGDGTVGLAPDSGGSGTRWRLSDNGGAVTLECLGDVPGSKFLDGRTGDGTVGLAPDNGFSGTRWQMSDL